MGRGYKAQQTFTDLLVSLGDCGRYQIRLLLLASAPSIFCSLHALSLGFIAATPNHRCSVEGYDNAGNTMSTYENDSIFLNGSIPWDSSLGQWSQCKRYKDNITDETVSCSRWVYDKTQYHSSLGMDWDLICDRKYLLNIAQSMYFAGMLTGSFIMGALSDRFGRKPIMVSSILLQLTCGVLLAFAPSYPFFIVLRFLLGAFHSGQLNTAFVMVIEMAGPKGQVWLAVLFNVAFTVGFLLVAVFALFIPDWFRLELAISIPEVVFVVYIFCISESARWLVQQGRIPEATKILRTMSRLNNKKLPSDIDEQLHEIQGTTQHHHKPGMLDLVRTPNMRRRSFILFYEWAVTSMVYWGISINSGTLPGGDMMINTAIAALVEIPSFLATIACFLLWGRRPAMVSAMTLAGVACMIAALVPKSLGSGWVTVSVTMVGKMAATAAFAMVFQYSAEAFPTVLRNTSVGIGSVFARLGSVLAPFLYLVGDRTHELVPVSTFAVLAIIGGILATQLPETRNQPLPETVEDGEVFGTASYRKCHSVDEKELDDMLEEVSHISSLDAQ